MVRVGGESTVYKNFEALLRSCDREDLDTFWRMVQEKLNTAWKPNVKEQELWVDLRRLYEPDPTDVYWNFPCHDLSTSWKFYDSWHVHHLSTQVGVDLFMLAEMEYPLSVGVLAVMIYLKLQCEENSELVQNLIQRNFYQYERKMQDL